MKNYANAAEVLPKELFNELRKHCTGMMLYVPEGVHHKEKRKLAMILHNQQTDVKAISSIVGLSTRRVLQIIAEERDKMRSHAPPAL